MHSSYAQKSRDNHSRTDTARDVKQEGGSSRTTLQSFENSPAAVAQRNLQATLNEGPKARSLVQLQRLLHQSPRVAALAQLSAMLQRKPAAIVQRLEPDEEELQMKAEPDVLQHRGREEEELLQGKFDTASAAPVQAAHEATRNETGMPDQLKTGIEALSGMDMSEVRVHANSAEPAQLNALAYTQGHDIHLAPGQERHIAHEAWHVVQQRQGRVKPTMQMEGAAINDDAGLEREADVMGAKAFQMKRGDQAAADVHSASAAASGRGVASAPIQCVWEKFTEPDPEWAYYRIGGYYYNAERDAYYYPDSGVLDYRSEPGGFETLDEEEAEALQHQIDRGHWTGLWVNTDNDTLYDPQERVLSLVDQPEIRWPVDARESYYTLLEIARDGGDVDAELRKAHEDLEGEGEEVPPRQITRGAKIGFEFQELGSKVEVTEPPPEEVEEEDENVIFERGDRGQAEYERALSRVPRRIATNLYGKDNRWYVVADGENLEFVTMPFESMADLRETMAEVKDVAWVFADAEPDTSYLLGETVVRILNAEAQAQPQANPDIPLDTLHNFIKDLADDDERWEALFGVSENFWNPETTSDEMEMVIDANKEIQGLADAVVQDVFGVADNAAAAGKIASIKGMLQLMANAAIHKAFFGGANEKDQPVLLKTHMGKTWQSLVDSEVITKTPTVDKLANLLFSVSEPLNDEKGDAKRIEALVKRIVGQVMRGIDPIWGSEKTPVSLDTEQEGRKQVLIELRRVPVLPISEWTEFAEYAYQYFITDAKQRFS